MKCEYCGKEFVSINMQRKYCSDKCRKIVIRKQDRERRARKNAEYEWAICTVCKRYFKRVKGTDELFCSTKCHSKVPRINHARKKAQDLTAKAVKRPTKTLDDWCLEARECGLDYGNYRTLIAQGKTFEQIKAENHQQTAHAHRRLHYNEKL